MRTIDIIILLSLLSTLIIWFIFGNTNTQSNSYTPTYKQQPSWLSPFYRMETMGTVRDPIQNTLHDALYSD